MRRQQYQGTQGNAMDVQEIIKTLSTTREPRATLYLNNRSIERFFSQHVSAIKEYVTSEALSGKLSAGLFSFLKGEVGGPCSRYEGAGPGFGHGDSAGRHGRWKNNE